MRRFLTLRLLLAGAVLSLGLIAAAAMHIAAVSSGTEIIIPAQAFDPRGLLTGHYAQVRYAISRADPSAVSVAPKPAWQPVWVAIAPADEGEWKTVSVGADKPQAVPAGGHLVRAEARVREGSPADLRYGIERIYAQQSEAEAIDRAVRAVGADARLKVVASLGGDGRLRVKALIMGGERTDFGWW